MSAPLTLSGCTTSDLAFHLVFTSSALAPGPTWRMSSGVAALMTLSWICLIMRTSRLEAMAARMASGVRGALCAPSAGPPCYCERDSQTMSS